MKRTKVAFVGAGNMAEAMINGMLAAGYCESGDVVCIDIRERRLAELEEEYGVRTASGLDALDGAETVVLAVKPQTVPEVLPDIKKRLDPEALVISVAAGIACATIEQVLGEGRRVVRVMPNTPALVGQGASAVACGRWATEGDIARVREMLDCCGMAVRVDEDDLDAVTALSGSGPAYVFYLIEAMMQAAGEMGLEGAVARELTLQTVSGAARLMAQSGEAPAELRARVTSPGGTTEAAIRMLERDGVRERIVQAVLAARDRAVELSAKKK